MSQSGFSQGLKSSCFGAAFLVLSFFFVVPVFLPARKRLMDSSALDAASWYVEVCLKRSESRLGLSLSGRA